MALHDPPAKKLTYKDYVFIPEVFELDEADVTQHMTRPPFARHCQLALRLARHLGDFVEAHALGEVLIAPMDVVLLQDELLLPDLLFISNERSSRVEEENVQRVPDLAVEILPSYSARAERGLKWWAYERWGVLECWMLDPGLKDAEVLERTTQELLRRPSDLPRCGRRWFFGPWMFDPERFPIRRGLLSQRAHLSVKDVLTTPLLPGLEIPLAEIFRD